MKKSHILAIGVIAIAIAIIVSTAGDASTYVNFDQAYQLAATGSSTQVHVVGELPKDAAGNILGLLPQKSVGDGAHRCDSGQRH